MGFKLFGLLEEEEIELGFSIAPDVGSEFDRAVYAYNNIVSILNEKASKYLNSDYATSARCIGSAPRENSSELKFFSCSLEWFMKKYSNMFLVADENYKSDLEQLKVMNYYINSPLASRIVLIDDMYNCVTFGVRVAESPTYVEFFNITYYEDEEYYDYSVNDTYDTYMYAVFTLKPDLMIISGDGDSVPYTLATEK
mgnify:CR=1 FL=1